MHDVHGIEALRRIDLNLLLAFDALAREKSVTRAADQVGITQSAMSHTLRRLREHFGDALLVRSKSGMALTPRAESLLIPVRRGLQDLARAIAPEPVFQAANAERTFRIVSPDLFDVLVLPALLRRLTKEAPGVNLAVVPAPPRLSESLETGELDLAVAPVLLGAEASDLGPQTGPDLTRRSLLRDRFRCFMRRDHPALKKRKRITLPVFAELAHVLVTPSGSGPGVVDHFLSRQGLKRRVTLRVPTFLSALAIVKDSDLVLSAPSSLARTDVGAKLHVTNLPLELPEHAITLVWHPRFTDEPGHRWLRDLIAACAKARLATG